MNATQQCDAPTMPNSFRGIGNFLFWDGDVNVELCWIPPLPSSRFAFDSLGSVIRFHNFFSIREMQVDDILVIRKHVRPIRYFVFVGQTNNQGFRLAFIPLSMSRFEKMIELTFPSIAIESVASWWDHNEKQDRIDFNLPERPSG